MEYLINILI